MIKSIKNKDDFNFKDCLFGIQYKNKSFIIITLCIMFLGVLLVYGHSINIDKIDMNLKNRNISPNFRYLFGTDWIGRDMFYRTIKGLGLSIKIGVLTSIISVCIALTLGITGAVMGVWIDGIIIWIIDLWMSIPNALIIILISVTLGGGIKGVIIGISITHWTTLARIIRAEVIQIKQSEYVKISKNFGKNKLYIITNHILPHILPHILVGFIVIFPHAILHEASITFLGFGLSPHEPAIGIILSESMKYLVSGKWWLVFFPGVSLVGISFVIDCIGKQINKLINSNTKF